MVFVPSTHMLADALTKPTGPSKLEEFVTAVGLTSETKDNQDVNENNTSKKED